MWYTILVRSHLQPLNGNNLKIRLTYLLFSLLLCSALLAQVKSTDIKTIDGQKFYIHKVEKKQSLYAITKLYEVSTEDLMKYNPELRDGLKAGSEIKIPYTTKKPAAVAVATVSGNYPDTLKYLVHKVAAKETVYGITKKYQITEKQLIQWNTGLTEGLKEGQLLVVGERKKAREERVRMEEKGKDRLRAEDKPKVEDKRNTAAAPTKTNVVHKAAHAPEPILTDSSYYRTMSRPSKATYNIGLMLPFKFDATLATDLNELVRNGGSFPQVPGIAADFYLGFKKAADSLHNEGFDLNLVVYDVDDVDSLKPTQIIADPGFKDLDLIFGPFYPSSFKTISKKAREFHIPIVSPLTQENKILHNNLYTSKTNPSKYTLIETLAEYCMDSLTHQQGAQVILVAFDNDKKQLQFTQAFKKYYNDRLKKMGRPIRDTLLVARGAAAVKNAISTGKRNIVVTLSTNPVNIADFLTQLSVYASQVRADVQLCGWEALMDMDNIDLDYLNQLKFTFASQYNLTNTAAYAGLASSYLSQQETLPGDYYFMGFDVGFYYLSLLKQQGPAFSHKLDENTKELNYMRFRFTRPDRSTGFDNRGVYIFKTSDYQIQKTGWR